MWDSLAFPNWIIFFPISTKINKIIKNVFIIEQGSLFCAWMKELKSLKQQNEAKSFCQMCWYLKKKSLSDSLPSKLNLEIQLRIRNWGTTEVDQRKLFLYYSTFLSSDSWEPESRVDPGCWWHSWDLSPGIAPCQGGGAGHVRQVWKEEGRGGGLVWEGFWELWCVHYDMIGEIWRSQRESWTFGVEGQS